MNHDQTCPPMSSSYYEGPDAFVGFSSSLVLKGGGILNLPYAFLSLPNGSLRNLRVSSGFPSPSLEEG